MTSCPCEFSFNIGAAFALKVFRFKHNNMVNTVAVHNNTYFNLWFNLPFKLLTTFLYSSSQSLIMSFMSFRLSASVLAVSTALRISSC